MLVGSSKQVYDLHFCKRQKLVSVVAQLRGHRCACPFARILVIYPKFPVKTLEFRQILPTGNQDQNYDNTKPPACAHVSVVRNKTR